MASGVQMSDDAYARFGEVKMGKNYRYMTMVIQGGSIEKNEMHKKGADQKADYNEMLAKLPADKCCFIVLDANVKTRSGAQKQALFAITWCPDTANVKDKMLYASSKDALNKISDSVTFVQANDLGDLDYEDIMALGSKK